jgi:ABC-type transport system involved in multi-copper enzyme maturation permease subunit
MSNDRAVFNAILWKEFRENFKWAVLGLLFVSVGMFLFLQRLLGQSSNGGELNWADVSNTLFWATPFLAPVVGLLIGLAQVVLENRGDQWSFLTHRPVRRTTLFWGKAVAGILLYIGAVGLPLAGGILWMAMPGHLPMPMDMHLVLPVVADILCGLVYYFAGLLSGMRDGRWYASRVMGIGMGFVCSIALSIVPEFWQAVACSAVGILITSASAWGTFVQGGRFESQSRIMRFATSVSIGAGLLITGVVVFGVGASFLPAIVSNSSYTRYRITSDGAIVKALYEDDTIVEVQDLQGKPIERYRDREARRMALANGVVASQSIGPWTHFSWNGDYRKTSESFRPFASSDTLSNGAAFTWYYMTRLGRIAAYDNRSARLVGWLTPRGFVYGTDMPADRFEHPLAAPIATLPTLIAFEDAVFRVDLDHRHIEKIFTSEAGESVTGASDSNLAGSNAPEFADKARFVAISTTKRVVIQSREGTTQLSAPLDPNFYKFGSVIVYRSLRTPEPQTFTWYTVGLGMPGFVTQYGSTGTPVTQYTLPSLLKYDNLTWGYVVLRSIMENLAMRTLLWKHSIFTVSTIRSSPKQLLVSWLIPLLEGVLFAALAFARGRRYAFPAGRLSLWTAIGFALGPLGFALMLSLLEWPALENCPACGRPRLVTRDSCEHCSKPFTSPQADGTEVFEPITSN